MNYVDEFEFRKYHDRYLNGDTSQEVMVYFQQVAVCGFNNGYTEFTYKALHCIGFIFDERGEYLAAKDNYYLVVSHYNDPKAASVLGSSCLNLARLYRYGFGVDQDINRAIEIYRIGVKYAIHVGCRKALDELGVSYS